VDWIYLVQCRDDGNEPSGSIKGAEFFDSVSLSRKTAQWI
jgi:hypothetical protein